jgi:diguanylate cyclase (GGDEF)-like protein/PAS domain S-box-containing protein
MSTLPPEYSVDFNPTDIFSAGPWTSPPAPPARPVFALDAVCARIAVDFHAMRAGEVEDCVQRNLELLRAALAWDCVFLATLHPRELLIQSVQVARGEFAEACPEGLRAERLGAFPWLQGRLEHLRISELRDTRVASPEQAFDARKLAGLHMGSVVLISLKVKDAPVRLLGLAHTQPQRVWDSSLLPFLKLAGTSLASGLERIGLEARIAKLDERSKLAQAAANDGLWDYDIESQEVYLSPSWRAMLGYDDENIHGSLDWRSLVHPEDLPRVDAAIRDHLEGRTAIFESEHRLRHRNGGWRWVSSRATARVDKDGQLQRMVGIELDITERKLYEEALFREKESAQIALRSIGDGVITTDGSSIIDYINPVAEELMGWPLADAMGRPVEQIFRALREVTCEPLENPLTVAIRDVRPVKSGLPILLIRRDGHELYIECTAAPIRDREGKVTGGVLVFHDVSESRELNKRLAYQASHDLLTGVANRRAFEAKLSRALKKARAGGGPHAVLYLDIDQLKIVNDTCGHRAGDALLAQVGKLLMSRMRWRRDTLARLGGDEFGILLEGCSFEDALHTAEGLRESVSSLRFTWEDRVFRPGLSIGVVPVNANDEVAQILSAADSACAAAKESGRNRVHSFAGNDVELARRRSATRWVSRLNAALEEGRFELFSMPILALQQAEAGGVHCELLLRLRDEADGIVAPKEFIPVAERYRLIPAIDRWVIENAFRWLVSRANEEITLCSINLSGQSLCDDKLLPFVIEQLQGSGVDATRICFEITETAAVASMELAKRFIHALRDLGCKFALDDFGTGWSSYGYLKELPVDFLKIDGRFVREIVHNHIDRAMVRSFNELGHLTGKRTIAEFAENPEIIQMLTMLGVDYAQGYGIAQPRSVLGSAMA